MEQGGPGILDVFVLHRIYDLDARILAFQFVSPIITTRLLFFSAGSWVSERTLGRKMIQRPVHTFLRLVSTEASLR